MIAAAVYPPPSSPPPIQEPPPDPVWQHRLLLGGMAAAKFGLHLAVAPGYGYFRDELYYLASTDHLAWGYVDHPPLSIAVLAVWSALFGDGLLALRFLPAVAGAAVVALVGWMARRLGGGPFAQALAMLAAIIAPLYLFVHHVYSMNAIDGLVWAGATALVLRIAQEGSATADRGRDARVLWLALGVVLGLGLLNKVSVLWLGGGLALGLLVTPQRRWLATPWPWAAAAVALLLFVPHLVWQGVHGWPTLEFVRNATGTKMADISPLAFVSGQVLAMHPLNVLVWGAGLAFLLVLPAGRPVRVLGVLALAVLAFLAVSGTARAAYAAPVYPVLFAAGGVVWERVSVGGRRWLRPLLLGLLVVGGAALAPLTLPVLPVEAYVAYQERLGVGPAAEERHEMGVLPQHYADMFGWEELVAAVDAAYRRLPPEERAGAGIFAQNYGEAGAIDVLGRHRGLPRAMSGHNSYWLWGPRVEGEVVLIIGGDEADYRDVCGAVELLEESTCTYCMPYEAELPIWGCRGLRQPLARVWPQVRHYD